MNSSEESQTVPRVSIDTTDFYRSGAPNPLPALPLETQIIDQGQTLATYVALQPKITTALRNAGLGSFTMHLTKRYALGESPTSDYTILIEAQRDPQRDNLTIAVNEVLSVLFTAQVTNVHVEIIDPRAHRLFFVPQVSTTFLIAIWPVLQREIIAILDRHNYDWSSFTLLNRGHQESESEAVVVIGVRKSATLRWKAQIRSNILDLLEKKRLSMDVIFVREALPAAGGRPSARSLSAFHGPVKMGSSIGMEDNSGTLGGYFTLERGGQNKVFGVTNHHVVFSDGTKEKAKIVGKSDLELLGVKKAKEFPWTVYSPSLADRDSQLKTYDENVETFRQLIDGDDHPPSGSKGKQDVGIRQKIDRATWKGNDTTNLEAQIQSLETARDDEITRKGQVGNTTNLTFANVFATSGRAQYGSRDANGNMKAMDWALLDPRDSRMGDNTVSERCHIVLEIAEADCPLKDAAK